MQLVKTIQLGASFAQSLWAFHKGGTPHPFSASFAVSNKCNIRCSYCNFPNIEHTDLTLLQVEVIFERLWAVGVRRLGILGGEPLYRKDILEIIALGKRFGFSMSMNTNLLLYDQFRNKLNDIDYFFTSLDGPPEIHARNRGKHAYTKVVEGIDHLIKEKKRITIICVLTEGSELSSVDYLLDFAEKRGITVHFQPECYESEVTLRKAGATLSDSNTRNLWNYIIEQKDKGRPVFSSMPYLQYIANWDNYAQSAINDPTQTCAAGKTFFFVDATGRAFHCAYTHGKTEGVSLLQDNWERFFEVPAPCTKCIVGPMLEFNLLTKKPMASMLNALNNI